MTKLSVNINKIALLRNSRGANEPNLELLMFKILSLGAAGITVHPRADRRHITPNDARMVVNKVKNVETNFEGDLREEFLDLVFECKPTQCTLVPVKPGEITSNHGWDVKKWAYILEATIKKLKDVNIRTSLFVEAGDIESIEYAHKIGADRIEIYTEPYAKAFAENNVELELKKFMQSAEIANKYGIGVNAGHDLTHENLPLLVKNVPNLLEVSIGQHLLSYALWVGIEKAMTAYLQAINSYLK